MAVKGYNYCQVWVMITKPLLPKTVAENLFNFRNAANFVLLLLLQNKRQRTRIDTLIQVQQALATIEGGFEVTLPPQTNPLSM